MNRLKKSALTTAVSLALLGGTGAVFAAVNVQCPGDKDGDAAWNAKNEKAPGDKGGPPANIKCMHLIAGDSFAVMSDTNPLYTFGFIMIVAICVALANWFILAVALFTWIPLAMRTPLEEAKLIEAFGDEYRDYMARTGAYLPKLLKR